MPSTTFVEVLAPRDALPIAGETTAHFVEVDQGVRRFVQVILDAETSWVSSGAAKQFIEVDTTSEPTFVEVVVDSDPIFIAGGMAGPRGEKGDTGATGPQGIQGDPGPSTIPGMYWGHGAPSGDHGWAVSSLYLNVDNGDLYNVGG